MAGVLMVSGCGSALRILGPERRSLLLDVRGLFQGIQRMVAGQRRLPNHDQATFVRLDNDGVNLRNGV